MFTDPFLTSGAYISGVNANLYHGIPQCFDNLLFGGDKHLHFWQTGLKLFGLQWRNDMEVEWVQDDDFEGKGTAPTSLIWDTGTNYNAGPTYLMDYITGIFRKKGLSRIMCDEIRDKYQPEWFLSNKEWQRQQEKNGESTNLEDRPATLPYMVFQLWVDLKKKFYYTIKVGLIAFS